MIFNLIRRASDADRAQKLGILLCYDVAASVLALVAAFWVRLGEPYWPWSVSVLGAAAVSILAGVLALHQLHVYRIVLRYFDLRTVTRIFFGAAIAAAAWVLTVYIARSSMVVDGVRILVPRSVAFIYCGFLFMLLFLGRYAMAWLLREAERIEPGAVHRERKKVAIYGANAAGISLADSVRRNPQYSLCAFVDDDPALHGQIVAGARIYPPDRLPELAQREELTEVFLAPADQRGRPIAFNPDHGSRRFNRVRDLPADHTRQAAQARPARSFRVQPLSYRTAAQRAG
jgi:FlaA1/EpsC-like NDP-sugar epimerase